MVNVLVPMAGAGSRFVKAGFALPKPLVSVGGVPMGKVVVDNLKNWGLQNARFVFIIQTKHAEAFDLDRYCRDWGGPSSVIVKTDGLTAGALCTCLLAVDFIDSKSPLLVANCDQYLDGHFPAFPNLISKDSKSGIVLTMRVPGKDRKWSYARTEGDQIVEVAEKKPISDLATVGVYGFSEGSGFVQAAKDMILADDRTNGEFYVAPIYNRLLSDGWIVKSVNLGMEHEIFHGLGTPEDLEAFLARGVL